MDRRGQVIREKLTLSRAWPGQQACCGWSRRHGFGGSTIGRGGCRDRGRWRRCDWLRASTAQRQTREAGFLKGGSARLDVITHQSGYRRSYELHPSDACECLRLIVRYAHGRRYSAVSCIVLSSPRYPGNRDPQLPLTASFDPTQVVRVDSSAQVEDYGVRGGHIATSRPNASRLERCRWSGESRAKRATDLERRKRARTGDGV